MASFVSKWRKVGRETRYRLSAKPLQEVRDWVAFYENFWNERLANLNHVLEEQKMKADVALDFQYTSSADQVWKALTKSDILEQWIWANDF